jgi:hypothetical protein
MESKGTIERALRLTGVKASFTRSEFTMRFRVLMIMALLVTQSAAVSATSVVAFSFDSLCETSARIAHVKVLGSRSIEVDGGIRTETRFQVFEGIKGESGEEIVIALPGGRVGDKRTTVPGMPRFTEGEETILFLSGPDGMGSPWPVGLGQGCYRVTSTSGDRTVRLQSGVTPIPEGTLYKRATSQPYQVGLKSFLQTVRERVGVEVADPEK